MKIKSLLDEQKSMQNNFYKKNLYYLSNGQQTTDVSAIDGKQTQFAKLIRRLLAGLLIIGREERVFRLRTNLQRLLLR